MDAALQSVLHKSFGHYVKGLERVDTSSSPIEMRNLELKIKEVQEEMDEDGTCPFDLNEGRIGSITLSPGWMGDLEVVATNITLKFTFNPMKAMGAAMRPAEPDYYDPRSPGPRQFVPPPQPVPPRYCAKHNTSDKRHKADPCERECKNCHTKLQTSYVDFTLCPPCSENTKRCMLCGDLAPESSGYIPQMTLNNGPGPYGPPPQSGPWSGPPAMPQQQRGVPFPEAAGLAGGGRASRVPPFPELERGTAARGSWPPPPPPMGGYGGGPGACGGPFPPNRQQNAGFPAETSFRSGRPPYDGGAPGGYNKNLATSPSRTNNGQQRSDDGFGGLLTSAQQYFTFS